MKDDWVYVRHILDEMDYLADIRKSVTYTQFLEDKTLVRAVTRSLEIIGEASKNISEGSKAAFSGIPWKSMAGFRDRIVHGYFDINYEIVWDVVTNKVPQIEPDIRLMYERIKHG